MATYSNNTTIKIDTQQVASRNSAGGVNDGSFSYTVPANSYAMVSIANCGFTNPFSGSYTAVAQVTIGGQVYPLSINTFDGVANTAYFPAGSAFYFEATSSVLTTAYYRFVATIFTNTP